MDNTPALEEFKAYRKLSEEVIAGATKKVIAEARRTLAPHAAHYERPFCLATFKMASRSDSIHVTNSG
jgi:hypothetical protein